ncbi:MAG TPA: hypothetical protein VGS19_15340 [Streptosporangiaceae bacterium]|nr:hypothetical protein [Streptosporangiaceae bacterium]
MSIAHRVAIAATAVVGVAATSAFAVAAPVAQASGKTSFINGLHTITTIASTVPGDGDVNPYGVAVVGQSQGALVKGDILVSNFNNSHNFQGTGSTIVQVSPRGKVSVFASIHKSGLPGACPGGVGLTTALEILPGGWVVVGSLPTTDGMAHSARAGCLIVLDNQGHVRETFSGNGINGPWDMAAVSHGPVSELFVSNVLDGTVAANGGVVDNGSVLRLLLLVGGSQPPRLVNTTMVASGFPQRTDPNALVIGPTGLGVASNGTLYVADTLDSAIAAIPGATQRSGSGGTGRVVTKGGFLSNPLGLALEPDGNILTVNGGDGRMVETTPAGDQIAKKFVDKSGNPPGSGALFGLALAPHHVGVYYVDDAVNTFRLLH